MKYRAIFVGILLTFVFAFMSASQQDDFPILKGPYLGQKPPGEKAELFAPDVIRYEVHESPSISLDEKEIIISSMSEGTKYFKMVDGIWQLQTVLPFEIPDNCNGMFVSPSGKRLYFLIWEDNMALISKYTGQMQRSYTS